MEGKEKKNESKVNVDDLYREKVSISRELDKLESSPKKYEAKITELIIKKNELIKKIKELEKNKKTLSEDEKRQMYRDSMLN